MEKPASLGLAAHRHVVGGHEADHWSIAGGDLGNGADDLEFKLGFLIRVEDGDDGFFIERADGSSKDHFIILSDIDLLHLIEKSCVFFVSVRLGVDEIQGD